MTAIFIPQFGGIQPQVSPRLLPDGGAQLASNLKLVSGELRPMLKPATVSTPTRPAPATSIYLARDGSSQAWMTWQKDVDVVKAPLPADVEARFYWTGDGEPRYGTFSAISSGGANDYPHTYYSLGVPNPQIAPGVSHSGGTGSASTRYYCYTFFSALGEESGPSPVSTTVTGKVDGTWSISAMDDVPTSSGTGTAAYASGSTTFTNAASAPHWLRVGDEVVISATTLVVTAVPTSSSFKVAGNYAAATSWARKAAWNTSGMTKRLYRTSGTLATFQLVAENITTTTYSDTLTDALILGDELISAGWEPPPATLTGVVTHSSGSLVGFTGTLLCASVPYQPHAWVTAYQLSTEYDIVGIASYGSEIAIATLGTPYVASGVEPESVTMQKINGLYPCLSKRSVVSVGDGAVYASGHGLMYIGQSGVSLYTKKFFSKDEWITHLPANMVCEFAYGRVYVSTTGSNGLKYMFIFEGDVLTTADFTAYDLYTDAATGTLYVAAASSIQEWDHAGSAPLTMAWKSKRFVLPPPQNFGAAKIEFDQAVPEAIRTAILDEIASKTAANAALMAAGNTGGSYGAKSYNVLAVDNSDLVPVPDVPAVNEVTFILYSKGVPVFARVVSSEKAFRLPAGFKTDEIEVQVNSQCVVNAIRLATTMTALNQA